MSRRIRELELALGTKVFVRSGRTLRISPEGAALLGYANELLSTADEMALRVSTGDPLRGTLRLGVSGRALVGLDTCWIDYADAMPTSRPRPCVDSKRSANC